MEDSFTEVDVPSSSSVLTNCNFVYCYTEFASENENIGPYTNLLLLYTRSRRVGLNYVEDSFTEVDVPSSSSVLTNCNFVYCYTEFASENENIGPYTNLLLLYTRCRRVGLKKNC